MAYSWLHALSGMCARMAGAAVSPRPVRVKGAAAVDGHAAEEVPRRLPLHLGRRLLCVLSAVKHLHLGSPTSATWKLSCVTLNIG